MSIPWLIYRLSGQCFELVSAISIQWVACRVTYSIYFFFSFLFLSGQNIDSALKERFGFLISVLNVQVCKKIPVYFFFSKMMYLNEWVTLQQGIYFLCSIIFTIRARRDTFLHDSQLVEVLASITQMTPQHTCYFTRPLFPDAECCPTQGHACRRTSHPDRQGMRSDRLGQSSLGQSSLERDVPR